MRKLLLLLVLLLSVLPVAKAHAHAADMYFHNHIVTLSPDGIQVTWELAAGPMVAQAIWHDADQNGDEVVSSAEAQAWSEAILPVFSAELNGAALDFTLETTDWPTNVDAFSVGDEAIRIHLQADWPFSIDQAHVVSLHNHFNPKNSLNGFDVRSEGDITFEAPSQDKGSLDLRFGRSAAMQNTGPLTTWKSNSPSIPWVVESLGLGSVIEEDVAQSPSGTASILQSLVKKQSVSPGFLLAALLIAVLLGMLHALSPGHGKTIIAAYLVGAQGKLYHAIALGVLVTAVHTGSVLALGLLTLAASRYFLAADMLPILELLSGLLICFLGVGLLTPRLRDWRIYHHRQMQNRRPPFAVLDTAEGKKRLVLNQPVEESGPPHSHDPSTLAYIPKKPTQGNPLAGIRWRSLVALGVSGGLVPCPDAIAILLIAVTINRLAFGMSLIVAFSAGLALILIAIGILIVQGKRLFQRLQWFDRVAYAMPVLSAIVVLGAGAVLVLSTLRTLAAASSQGEKLPPAAESPRFERQQARIIYTIPDKNQRNQLWTVQAAGGEPQQITDQDQGVWDYALAPDYAALIYTAPDELVGSRLWQWLPASGSQTLLLECPTASCSGVVWSPDGRGILYNRLEFDTLGIPSIWWLEFGTRETAPLFQNAQTPGFNPKWSADGKWLSYTSINPQEIQIYQLETGVSQSLPTQTGSAAIWSPDGETFLLLDVEQSGEQYLTRLLRYDIASQKLVRLTEDQSFNENLPAWSPDGEWIAIIRRKMRLAAPARGDQIWLLRPDGSEAHPVTQDEDFNHGLPQWSPDSRYLLYDAYRADAAGYVSAVYILDLETGTAQEVARPGARPIWLP